MYRYKVTAIGMLVNDWQDLRNAIFGDSPAVFEQYGATASAEFHFDTPQTPVDLGPLVRVELLPSP